MHAQTCTAMHRKGYTWGHLVKGLHEGGQAPPPEAQEGAVCKRAQEDESWWPAGWPRHCGRVQFPVVGIDWPWGAVPESIISLFRLNFDKFHHFFTEENPLSTQETNIVHIPTKRIKLSISTNCHGEGNTLINPGPTPPSITTLISKHAVRHAE